METTKNIQKNMHALHQVELLNRNRQQCIDIESDYDYRLGIRLCFDEGLTLETSAL